MRVSLQPLTEGIYIVVWRAVTADTHKTEARFRFRIGERLCPIGFSFERRTCWRGSLKRP